MMSTATISTFLEDFLELLENLDDMFPMYYMHSDDMFPMYYMHSDIFGMLKSSTTHHPSWDVSPFIDSILFCCFRGIHRKTNFLVHGLFEHDGL